MGVAPRDALEDLHRRRARIDLHGAFGAAERDVDDRALVGHQRGERLHLGRLRIQAETDAALGRQLVMTVLGPPGANDLDVSVRMPHRELERVEAVARADLVEQSCWMRGERGRAIEVRVDVIFERASRRLMCECHSGPVIMPRLLHAGGALEWLAPGVLAAPWWR